MNDTPDQKPDISVLLRPSSGPASDPGDRRMGGGEGMDRQRERRFWTMRRTLQLAGAVVLVALLGYALWTTTGGSICSSFGATLSASDFRSMATA